ncbi:Bug family tripartite tricarboxylate transporter substrate binding protein [Propylenella binzhouense]|uniref:Tripartite-type tricarboxylate transporter receptor subunit TctC n=1 Tax=Propylenella binzhouense TaxID=2555902 RepID=A0A964WTZ4_9HYPH|nr:tripartite tricarboxylate transporter substrate-binding protein [Propylenella binzhouense]MYZ48516.1 hypothetical protein [Propylenella binzhouense]
MGFEMTRRGAKLALAALLAISASVGARAQSVEDFYKGKSIDVVIAFSAGGGYDLYGRLLARHMGKHIPGNPTLVPQNMPGAGTLKATKYLYSVAPKDGTVFGVFSRTMPLAPVVGLAGADFDARKFTWLGSMAKEVTLCVVSDRSPVDSWEDALKTEFKLGGEGKGADPDIFANVIKTVFDAKDQLVTGYPGTADMYLAIERGELDGMCGLSYSSLLGRWGKQLQDGSLKIILQGGLQPHPELKDVPNMVDLAQDARKKQILKLILAPQAMARPFAAPPGVPEDRAKALRDAFEATLKDPEFLAEAKKLNVEIELMSADDIQGLLSDLYDTPKDLAEEASKDAGL